MGSKWSTLQLVWMARHLGLGKAMKQYVVKHRRWPQTDLGTFPKWLSLWQATAPRIRQFRNQWKGQTVVCVGNGPSINDMDLDCLNGANAVGTNRAYKLLDRFAPSAFHLLVQDNYRLAEIGDELSKLTCPLHIGNVFFTDQGTPPAWLSVDHSNRSIYMPRINWKIDSDRLIPDADFSPGFSSDPTEFVCYGFSVIFSAIQFAAFFGARRIVCIGIDMDYSNGTNFVSGVPMHWKDFSYEIHCKPMFEYLNAMLRRRGVELVNATPGGKVDAITRMPLCDAMRK